MKKKLIIGGTITMFVVIAALFIGITAFSPANSSKDKKSEIKSEMTTNAQVTSQNCDMSKCDKSKCDMTKCDESKCDEKNCSGKESKDCSGKCKGEKHEESHETQE